VLPPSQFHEYVWVLNWLLKLVEFIAKRTVVWKGKRQEATENRILDYLNTKADSSSVGIIWADVFLKPIIEDVPFGVAFPPQLQGWKRLRLELRNLPYEIRNRWRVWRKLIPEKRVAEILLKLLREQRVQYNPHSQRYSRTI
jgi:hypothetical protein